MHAALIICYEKDSVRVTYTYQIDLSESAVALSM